MRRINEQTPPLPRFYFDGGYERFGGVKSDRDWIGSYLSVIPGDKRQAVCDQYEEIYMVTTMGEKREMANKFLYNEALRYHEKF